VTYRPHKDETGEWPRPCDPVDKTERRAIWVIALAVITLIVFASDAKAACNVPRSATVKGEHIQRDQRVNTTIALRMADAMDAPYSHHVAVVAAATQEDSQHNYPRGHGTSVGYLQLIDIHEPDGVGIDWRMKVRNSAGWFLRGARQLDPRGTARLATTRQGWGLIQRVQRSGHPTKYNKWIRESIRTVKLYRASCR
jgi:hypothetical protein